MTPEVLAYLQRSTEALKGPLDPKDQAKVLRVISQMTAKAAADIEFNLVDNLVN